MDTELKVKDKKEIRGYLFNLIVYTHEKQRAEYFQGVIKSFIEKYPCRAIFIKGGDETAKEFLETSDFGNLKGTCDQICITVSRSLLHKVPFIILPKLIPDLPIYLVWGQNPTSDNEILPYLQSIATRFVFDSQCAKNLSDFSSKMLEKIHTLTSDFMDVGWAHIGGWRDAIAETFQTQEKIAYLQQCNKIMIKYNSLLSPLIRHSAVQAIYLQGWLAAQLEWSFESISYNHEYRLKYKGDKTKKEIILIPQQRATLEPGRIFEVEFRGLNELNTMMTLAEQQSKVMVYLSTPEKCELPFSLPIPDLEKGQTVMKEVFYYKASKHYTNMLKVLKKIPWEKF